MYKIFLNKMQSAILLYSSLPHSVYCRTFSVHIVNLTSSESDNSSSSYLMIVFGTRAPAGHLQEVSKEKNENIKVVGEENLKTNHSSQFQFPENFCFQFILCSWEHRFSGAKLAAFPQQGVYNKANHLMMSF